MCLYCCVCDPIELKATGAFYDILQVQNTSAISGFMANKWIEQQFTQLTTWQYVPHLYKVIQYIWQLSSFLKEICIIFRLFIELLM